jgi:hypothetical protein
MKPLLLGSVRLRAYCLIAMAVSGFILVFLVWSDARGYSHLTPAQRATHKTANVGLMQFLAVVFLVSALVTRVCGKVIQYSYGYAANLVDTRSIARLPGKNWTPATIRQVNGAFRGTKRR